MARVAGAVQRVQLALHAALDLGLSGRRSADRPDPRELSVLIKTFGRRDKTVRLVRSIRRFYPDLDIIVADDGPGGAPYPSATSLPLPYDAGLSEGRNALIAAANTPYVLLLDDDFVFFHRTRLGPAFRVIRERPSIDILAGTVRDLPRYRVLGYYYRLQRNGTVLHYVNEPLESLGPLRRYDITPNFFIARVDRLKAVGWDPELKLAEHTDFFLRAHAAGLATWHYPPLEILHARHQVDTTYQAMRSRGSHYVSVMMKKHGLTDLVYER